jgi:hypothetical protein
VALKRQDPPGTPGGKAPEENVSLLAQGSTLPCTAVAREDAQARAGAASTRKEKRAAEGRQSLSCMELESDDGATAFPRMQE